MISDHSEEILNVNTAASTNPSWTISFLSHDQVIKWTKAKVPVYSDSVLCLGKCWIIQKQTKDGQAKWQAFNYPVLMQNCWESMKNQFS